MGSGVVRAGTRASAGEAPDAAVRLRPVGRAATTVGADRRDTRVERGGAPGSGRSRDSCGAWRVGAEGEVRAAGCFLVPVALERACVQGPELHLRNVHPPCAMGRLEPGELCDGAVCHVRVAEGRGPHCAVSPAALVQAVHRAGAIGGVLGSAAGVLGPEAAGSGCTVVDRQAEIRQ